jgi:hypothetical protein
MYNYWTIIHFPNNELDIRSFKGILVLKYHGYINNKLQKSWIVVIGNPNDKIKRIGLGLDFMGPHSHSSSHLHSM